MPHITEPSKKTPVIAEADVVVVGGGPGGLPAAVAAARHGAKVLLVERYGFLGGLATASLVAPILGHTASRTSRPIVAGFLEDLTERMHALGGAPTWQETLEKRCVPFDAEAFKRAADEMAREAGVLLLLHAMAVEVMCKDGRMDAVVIESKSGREAARGKVFIDATGDADLAFRAGAQISQGRGFDGGVESMGSFVHIGGIEGVTPEQAAAAQAVVEGVMREGRLRFYHGGFGSTNDVHHDHYSPNMTRWPGDSTNVRHLTAAEVGVREQVWKL